MPRPDRARERSAEPRQIDVLGPNTRFSSSPLAQPRDTRSIPNCRSVWTRDQPRHVGVHGDHSTTARACSQSGSDSAHRNTGSHGLCAWQKTTMLRPQSQKWRVRNGPPGRAAGRRGRAPRDSSGLARPSHHRLDGPAVAGAVDHRGPVGRQLGDTGVGAHPVKGHARAAFAARRWDATISHVRPAGRLRAGVGWLDEPAIRDRPQGAQQRAGHEPRPLWARRPVVRGRCRRRSPPATVA